MKRISSILLGILSLMWSSSPAFGQDYLESIKVESCDEKTGVFLSEGVADKKNDVPLNAIQSLMHALFYQGAEGVRSGKTLLDYDTNKLYINGYFNDMNRGKMFVTALEEVREPSKNFQKRFQGSYRITVNMSRLYRSLQEAGVMKLDGSTGKSATPIPTIIVVPYKKQGESYASIMENSSDVRMAVTTVQKGFENKKIKTVDLQGKLDALSRRAAYESNTADSNDKQLLLSSGADVYVVVDLKKDSNNEGICASLSIKAYETASGTIWGAQEAVTNRYRTASLSEAVCARAVNQAMPNLLTQITQNYSQPTRVVLQIAVSNTSTTSLSDVFGSDGEMIVDLVQSWLDENAYNGDYHMQGFVDESAVFDYVTIAKYDEKGAKMTTSKFASILNRYLRGQSITATYRIEGNTIYLTLQ